MNGQRRTTVLIRRLWESLRSCARSIDQRKQLLTGFRHSSLWPGLSCGPFLIYYLAVFLIFLSFNGWLAWAGIECGLEALSDVWGIVWSGFCRHIRKIILTVSRALSHYGKPLAQEQFYLIYKLFMPRRNVEIKFLGVRMLICCFGSSTGTVQMTSRTEAPFIFLLKLQGKQVRSD